ncbi:hypothetical protein FRC14_002550 [Serendipita sp. 396]|nr:hypothetical protein FRC14_002550 [Serendipita sp. 396]KAG8784930.1 hypothetical protein FRC15_002318 [Serendipita sp. 397]KAG8867869.1 hypothetical protein FRC20_004624 [Serendipita sp. 405]
MVLTRTTNPNPQPERSPKKARYPKGRKTNQRKPGAPRPEPSKVASKVRSAMKRRSKQLGGYVGDMAAAYSMPDDEDEIILQLSPDRNNDDDDDDGSDEENDFMANYQGGLTQFRSPQMASDDSDTEEDSDDQGHTNMAVPENNTRNDLAHILPRMSQHDLGMLAQGPQSRSQAGGVPSSPIAASQERSRNSAPRSQASSGHTVAPRHHVYDVTSNHQGHNVHRLPDPRAYVIGSQTPKSVSFDDAPSSAERLSSCRRSRGLNPKPWHMAAHTPHSKEFLRDGKETYRHYILFEDAYPSQEERAAYGRAAWDAAITKHADAYSHASTKHFNTWILRMFGDTAWSSRGAMKTEAKRLITMHYGLFPPETLAYRHASEATRQSQEFTKERVAYLLKDYEFLNGEFQGRQKMPFTNVALCLVIERAVYRGFTLEGRQFLNPMPYPLVALAATALHNALEEWATGYYVRRPMKEDYYASIYRRYCKKLLMLKAHRPNRFLRMMTSFFAFCQQTAREAAANQDIDSDDDNWRVYGNADDSDDDDAL